MVNSTMYFLEGEVTKEKLSSSLEQYTFTVIPGDHLDNEKLGILVYRGSGFGIKGRTGMIQFGKEVVRGLNIPQTNWGTGVSFMVCGPGNSFGLKDRPVELEKDIILIVTRFMVMGIKEPIMVTQNHVMHHNNNHNNHVVVANQVHRNTDGVVTVMSSNKVYYCSRWVGAAACSSDLVNRRGDGQCGPEDGPQCLSCKMFQDIKDSSTPSKYDLKNVHVLFEKFLNNVIFSGFGDTDSTRVLINNEAYNPNRSTKIIFGTCLEIVHQLDLVMETPEFKSFNVNEIDYSCKLKVKGGVSGGGEKFRIRCSIVESQSKRANQTMVILDFHKQGFSSDDMHHHNVRSMIQLQHTLDS